MSAVSIRRFRAGEAVDVAAWAYQPPYEIYDGAAELRESYLSSDSSGFGYYAVTGSDHAGVIAFCCFGPEARVTGQSPVEGTIDIGGGVHPDRLSEGIATELLPVVMGFARERFAPKQFRTAVASFNERSTRLCLSAGFEIVRRFEGPGREFQELVRIA